MRKVIIGKKYRHFKNKDYIVLNVAKSCEDERLYVVYASLYDDSVWIREYDDFVSEVDKVKYPLVQQKYRFEEIND